VLARVRWLAVTTGLDVREPAGEDELRGAWRLLARSFNWPMGDDDKFLATVGPNERMRVAMVDGEVAGFSRVRPFGQFFGGRSVPMAGYSPVGVAPEFRGRGLGSTVTAAHFPVLRERGEVLAGLMPATTRLYRGVGFELGAVWAIRGLPIRSLQMLPPKPGVSVRRATLDDAPAIEACYARHARSQPGWLDRPEVWWKRILVDAWDERHVYVVDGTGGELAGYVAFRQEPDKNARWGFIVAVSELIADEVDVAVALWRMLGTSSSVSERVTTIGPPEHPLLLLLPEQDLKAEVELRYMLRLVDAPGAVAARGFPPVSVTVDLEVTDRQCDWNSGSWRLVVEDGVGRLERGGRGDVRLGIGAFASLYSGYSSAHVLAHAGLLTGASERDHAALHAAFAGPTPWLADFF